MIIMADTSTIAANGNENSGQMDHEHNHHDETQSVQHNSHIGSFTEVAEISLSTGQSTAPVGRIASAIPGGDNSSAKNVAKATDYPLVSVKQVSAEHMNEKDPITSKIKLFLVIDWTEIVAKGLDILLPLFSIGSSFGYVLSNDILAFSSS